MAKSILNRLTDGTIKFKLTLPADLVKKAREEAVSSLSKRANMPGFRKGKAPEDLVKEKINKDEVNEDILRKLLPIAYQEAVIEHQIRPIMNPKIHVEKIEDDKDWEIEATTCEAPEVALGDYKKSVQKVTSKGKIALPGKEPVKPAFEDIAKAVLEEAKVKIPDILLEQETDRLLAQLLDDIKKLGLSLEQYLQSTKRTAEDLRNEYKIRAETDMKLEFVLQKIAEDAKITIEDKEVEEAIQKAKSPAEKQNLENNKYLLAAILRQQKTLDFLMGL